MLDLLLAGFVGLTYTCIQTLFFLNCLNSRRREQRRLEKVCRESARKISSDVGEEEATGSKKETGKKSPAEENGSPDEAGNWGEEADDENAAAASAGDRLARRPAARIGKTASPISRESLLSSQGVQAQRNGVGRPDDQTVEDDRDLASAPNDDPPPQREGQVITVNSNVIEVRHEADPPLRHADPIYESLDGESDSLLTRTTTPREDAGGRGDPLAKNALEIGEEREREPDVGEGCSSTEEEEEEEEEVGETYRKSSRPPDISLVGTISQILHSPPESTELGSSSGSSSPKGGEAVGREGLARAEPANGRGGSGPARVARTLPRATRRTRETQRGSLPRRREGGRPGPAWRAEWRGRRDEAAVTRRGGGGDPDQAANALDACHSTPAMAGAANAPPDSARCNAAAAADDGHSDARGEAARGQADGRDSSAGSLEWTCDPGENPLYGEALGDSLYYTASDRTSCDVSGEWTGDTDEGFETTVYEVIESPDTLKKMSSGSEMITITVSDFGGTASKDASEDDGRSTLYSYGSNIYEEIKSDSVTSTGTISKSTMESLDDAYSVSSGSQYENISESDTHGDSGYESPVKADVHSSDDTASVASISSQDHHYEDIDPSQMVRSSGGEGRSRESSSRRGRSSLRDASKESCKEAAEDPRSEEAARQRQRLLQGLDDLIAGVPPPDYDDQEGPLDDASGRPDVCTSNARQENIALPPAPPPPPEFGDIGSEGCNGTSEAPARRQLHPSLSGPPSWSSLSQCRIPLSRTTSEPRPPPPPPMPSSTPSPKTSPSASHRVSEEVDSSSPASSKPSSPRSTHSPLQEREMEGPVEEGVVRPSEFIRRNSQRSESGSFRGHKKLDRPMSLPLDVAEHYDKMLSAGKEKDTTGSQEDLGHSPQQGKSQMMNGKSLPFIPPKFPTQPSDSGLIKPSEYLRSLGGSTIRPASNGEVKSLQSSPHTADNASSGDNIDSNTNVTSQSTVPPCPLPAIPEATEEESTKATANAPPPPPAPPAPPASTTNTISSRSNTLSNGASNGKTTLPTISVTDLQSVQLRKIETKVAKPTSVRIPLQAPEPSFTSAKNDVIAELKMGVDITGIKKLKSERAKEEEMHDKIEQQELSRQFSAVKFVDHVPEVDNAGNRIPDWKRQMLARKAAERAKKEAEESRIQEAEEKRLQSIPPWKRQLMMRRDEDGKRDRPITARMQYPVHIVQHIKH